MIDRVREVLVEFAERVVGESGEVDDRFDPFQITALHVPQVHVKLGRRGRCERLEIAALIKGRV